MHKDERGSEVVSEESFLGPSWIPSTRAERISAALIVGVLVLVLYPNVKAAVEAQKRNKALEALKNEMLEAQQEQPAPAQARPANQ